MRPTSLFGGKFCALALRMCKQQCPIPCGPCLAGRELAERRTAGFGSSWRQSVAGRPLGPRFTSLTYRWSSRAASPAVGPCGPASCGVVPSLAGQQTVARAARQKLDSEQNSKCRSRLAGARHSLRAVPQRQNSALHDLLRRHAPDGNAE